MKDTRLEFVSIERRVGFEGMYIGIPLPKKKKYNMLYPADMMSLDVVAALDDGICQRAGR